MFSSSFNMEVKKTLSLHNRKIDRYGDNKEFSQTPFKIRYKSILPTKKCSYMQLNNIKIIWKPTVAHLLEDSTVSIEMRDRRSSDFNESIFTLKKRASDAWEMNLEVIMSVPMSEMKNGIPLNFNINILNAQVKSDVEMGKLKFKFDLLSADEATKTTFGKITFVTGSETSKPMEIAAWNMNKLTRAESIKETTSKLLTNYLQGNLNSDMVCNQIVKLLE